MHFSDFLNLNSSSMVNLSNQTEIMPSFHRRKKIIHLNFLDVAKFSHLVVKMDSANFKVIDWDTLLAAGSCLLSLCQRIIPFY
jgi:hypothetical protein